MEDVSLELNSSDEVVSNEVAAEPTADVSDVQEVLPEDTEALDPTAPEGIEEGAPTAEVEVVTSETSDEEVVTEEGQQA